MTREVQSDESGRESEVVERRDGFLGALQNEIFTKGDRAKRVRAERESMVDVTPMESGRLVIEGEVDGDGVEVDELGHVVPMLGEER